MIVTWKVEKGKPGTLSDKTVARLNRRVSQLKRGNRNFKIGITSDPVGRSRLYESRDGDRYHEMVVLYQTGSSDRIRKLEAALISKHGKDSDNEQGGGGGLLGNPPYYLYVVRSRGYARS